jgi:hypothetical protein
MAEALASFSVFPIPRALRYRLFGYTRAGSGYQEGTAATYALSKLM